MRCPSCSAANADQARFCLNCGARLALACPQCGAELPPQARFCTACGAQVGTTPLDLLAEAVKRLVPREYAERLVTTRDHIAQERRLVTILFSDVKGSTTLAEYLDPEEVLDIINGAFDFLIAPIYRYEGTLARLMGDAILAFFGAPIAHEDDPERACRAALDILQGAHDYAARLQQERAITGFNVRVGINTGLVVVGEVGSDLRVEYTAIGDAVNLASRLESAAEPGTILISDDTHRLIAPLFDTQAIGPLQVKGRTEPVTTHRVLALKQAPGKVRGIEGLQSPLVGRDRELGTLQEALERLRAGVGGIVTIVGEAGIGKSRLVAEARHESVPPSPTRGGDGGAVAPPTTVQWLEGRCPSYGASVAYRLWLDVLRSLLGVTEDAAPTALREQLRERIGRLCPEHSNDVYPYLARLLSLPLEPDAEAQLRDLDGQALKGRTFAAVETLLECSARHQPLALVCEDLHWADPTSLELLENLLSLTDRAPLLLLCAFRPDPAHGSWRMQETAARLYPHRHAELRLQPLSAADSQALVTNLLHVEDLPKSLRERILAAAEGNPFYVEEVIRSLIDSEAIARDQAMGRWLATRQVSEIAIPDTLQGVLMARIDRLEEDTRRVLRLASVIGRTFLYRVLAAIAQQQQDLDGRLLALQREEMIRERARLPELEYIFKHELTREAAYNGLLKRDRRTYHRQVAQALERLFPEREAELAALLAHHWELAEQPRKAVVYLQQAGDQARMLYAHQEAIGFYERALALLKQEGELELAARTLMKLGLVHQTAFSFSQARQAYDEACALWQAAARQPAAAQVPAPHALRMALEKPVSLDPGLAGDTSSMAVIRQLFSGLVALGHDMSVVPDVAESWEIAEGGRRCVFHLRSDVRWSDGTPVTAMDFQHAWKRMLHPSTGSSQASMLYDIRGARAFHQGEADAAQVGMRAPDDHTLEVELEGPVGYLLQLLTYAYPVHAHSLQVQGEARTESGNIATNGAFLLETREPGGRMVLVRNPAWHARVGGNVQRVELNFLDPRNWPAMLAMYEADELDVLDITWFPPESYAPTLQRHAGEHVAAPRLSTAYLWFDTNRHPFDDLRVRHAFALAVDKDTLSVHGRFSAATGGFVPPGMPGHSPGIALPYAPHQARDLLAEAGYPGGRGLPPIRLLAMTDPSSAAACQLLQVQWLSHLGVEAQLQMLDPREFLSTPATARSEVTLLAWVADYPDPDSFLRVGLLGRRFSPWRNEAFDALVQEARGLMDQSDRMRLYAQADRILVQEAVLVPVAYMSWHVLVKPWVRLPAPNPELCAWADIVIEPHGQGPSYTGLPQERPSAPGGAHGWH